MDLQLKIITLYGELENAISQKVASSLREKVERLKIFYFKTYVAGCGFVDEKETESYKEFV